MSHEYCDKCFELISNTIHLCNTNNITKCNQCESLREENERLRKIVKISVSALSYINNPLNERDSYIDDSTYIHNLIKVIESDALAAKQALEKIERVGK